MSCDHLICARCANPVIDGRCATCRAAKAELHGSPVQPQTVLLIALILALVTTVTVSLGYGLG
jgi:hypothetical protein